MTILRVKAGDSPDDVYAAVVDWATEQGLELYEHQDDLADVQQYALRIGLEIYRFDADMSGERFAKRVRDDFRGGVRSGVNGTPTFFINGVRYDGSWEAPDLLAAIEAPA